MVFNLIFLLVPTPSWQKSRHSLHCLSVPGAQDLRNLLWSSIDNDTSKDLDQVEWAEQLPDGRIRVLIGVADVDIRVPRGSLLDKHAQSETTSVYTGVKVFPMLPSDLSEGITSLNENEDRVADVVEFTVDPSGCVSGGTVYRALVRNRAQLAYNSVGAWLEGRGPAPAKVAANADLAAQLKLQDKAAQGLVGCRFQHGALDLETIETHPVMSADDQAVGITSLEKNRATSLIEEFMVAANGTVARIFEAAGIASIWRIVRTPKRWDRMVQVANGLGTKLPEQPDSKALNDFLLAQKQKDPDHFPDLSLTVVKLMGPGEYVLVKPNEPSPGHFGLAVRDYLHSTAPNRRFPDIITQRIMKAHLGQGRPALLGRRSERDGAALYADGRRRAQGGTHHAETDCCRCPASAHWPVVSGNRYRRKSEWHIRARAQSPRGRNADECRQTRVEAGCWRQVDRQADQH